jgi:flagellar basal body-associated protein FliL
LKAILTILLLVSILTQNCGLVLYSFSHHHHCTTQNACKSEIADCIPANDDCTVAQKVKDIGKQANNKETEKQFSITEYIFIQEEFTFNNKQINFATENKTYNCYNPDKLLWQARNVLYPPPNC